MINLFTGYFEAKDPQRKLEIDLCFAKNKANEYIDRIITFANRPTYQDFFNATKNYPNDINIFANADIYFDETIKLVDRIGAKDCFALTRWELYKGEIIPFEQRHSGGAKARHSQDVWIFRGAVNGVYGGFHLGIPGTDNRIAYEISKAYNISNPSLSIKAIHVHREEERFYTIPAGSLEKIPPPYKWVDQTKLT